MNNENLTTEDFKEKLKNTKNAVLLDVRSPEEIAMGTISEAECINFFDPDFANIISKLDKSKSYFLYCRSGARSGQACNMMVNMGFEVTNLFGGGYDDLSIIW